MTKELLKARVERHKEWLGSEETRIARIKLLMGQALTQKESLLLFEYLKKLENTLDKMIEQ